MSLTDLAAWTQDHLLALSSAVGVLLLGLLALAAWGRRSGDDRTPAAVVVASLAAIACTAYSADTSWRFAEHTLGMASVEERAAMFAAAELALFACALMARQNLRTQGAPGTAGLLVWFITAVQVIPAYSESGFVGGTVRAVAGPILAALLWHLAMGIELRHTKPGADSQSLPAVIARELRERLLSWLGLATRDRTAEQITRDRATTRAVRLASRPTLRRWGKSRLAAAVARAGVGVDPEQLDVLMQLLAARRGAAELTTVELPSPFETDTPVVTVEVDRVPDAPETYPALETAVPAVPEAYPQPPNCVPVGARRLPLMTRCGLPPAPTMFPKPTPVPAAEHTRTRPEVHAEYVPDRTAPGDVGDNPTDPDPADDGYGNPLSEYGIGLAAEAFKEQLLQGDIPSIRAIKAQLSVGQSRATEIQAAFREAQVAWRLAGKGVRS